MKPFEYYSGPATPPLSKKDFEKVFVYDKGKVVWEGHRSIYERDFIQELHPNGNYPEAVVQIVLDTEKYEMYFKKRGSEIASLIEEFRVDLFEYYNVKENPKRFEAFDLAWELAQSLGFEGIYDLFGKLVQLI
jgi:hypothetical protein